MSGTPWSVQRAKRKQPATTPTSRKRVRILDDTHQNQSGSSRQKKQQTLTQIQWANTPNTSFGNDWELQEIGLETGSTTEAVRSNSKKLKKRDSTLTQMDWLGDVGVHQDDTLEDIALLSRPNDVKQSVPQLDGIYDSPRKRRKRRLESQSVVAQSSSETSSEQDTQEYKPSKRTKRDPDPGAELRTPRRKSSRIACKALSDSKPNYLYMSQALLPRKGQQPGSKSQRKPVLEVMDSTELEDDLTPTLPRIRPQTPQRRNEIPSSQSPETLKRSKKRPRQRADLSPSKHLGRLPLSERSTNVSLMPFHKGLKPSESVLERTKKSPKRSKICVLKVPGPKLLQRSGYVDNSQHDVYSIPGTSSSRTGSRYSENEVESPVRVVSNNNPDEGFEVASSSQKQVGTDQVIPSSPPGLATDESLPELGDLIPVRRDNVTTAAQAESDVDPLYHQADEGDTVSVRDFGRPNSQQKEISATNGKAREATTAVADDDVMLLDYDNHGVASPSLPAADETADDNDSEFGPPVANDTQFNIGLVERTSTPDITPEAEESMHNLKQVKTCGDTVLDYANKTPALTLELDGERQPLDIVTTIPTPRLIQDRNSPAHETTSDRNKTSTTPTVSAFSVDRSTCRQSSTKVALNDVVHMSSSSSPPLPPIRSTTQRSIHPASLPRPSQVSTQEPTQHYMFSSMPNYTQYHEIDKIVIKDSSSTHLSQIPQYGTRTQGQHLRLIDESDDDVEDLDLDPSSMPQGRQSARKPTFLLRKETGSSLRSIHPLSDKSHGSTERGSDPVQSSSPLWPASTSIKPTETMKTKGTSFSKAPTKPNPQLQPQQDVEPDVVDDSDTTSSPISSPDPPALKGNYNPIPGFDNDTQSNFTQTGHITAAYIHRQRATGAWPDWFVPQPFQVSNFKRPAKKKEKEEQKKAK